MTVAILFVTFLQGLAAGICFDVATVKLPTRHRIGPVAYAQFARGNDLGNGLKVYPALFVGSAALLIALCIVAQATSQAGSVRYPLFAAAAGSVGCLLATARAAPVMLSLKTTPDDPDVIEQKLDRFASWHAWRTMFQLGAFAAMLSVWA